MREKRYEEIEERMEEVYSEDGFRKPVDLGLCYVVELVDEKETYFIGAIPTKLAKDFEEACEYFLYRMGIVIDEKVKCKVAKVKYSGGGYDIEEEFKL